MNTKQTIIRSLMALVSIFLVVGLTFGQDMIVNNNSNYGGTGTYNVKGNITTTGLTLNKSISGTVKMAKTIAGNQTIGTPGTNQTLTFGTLDVNTAGGAGNVTTTQGVAGVTVSSALSVADGSVFDIVDKTLSIAGTSTLNTTGALTVNNASSVVNYTRADGTAQTVLGLTYAGTLNLSGAGSAKDFSANASAVTMSHSGGALTVNHTLSVSTSGTFGTIADVTGPMSFGAGATTASINTISNISTGSLTNNATGVPLSIATLTTNAGTINAAAAGGISFTTSATNGSGTIEATSTGNLTFAALGGNAGTIQTTGSGSLLFTGAASNGGAITASAGSGAITFSNTLAHTAGTITPGSGNASFANTVTTSSGAVINGGAHTLAFTGNLDNSGTVQSAATGIVNFSADFVNHVGTLNLNLTSTWNYDGNSQAIAGGLGITYGNLNTKTGGTKTALGDITVAGNFDNGGSGDATVTTNMSTFALAVSGTKDNTSSTLEFSGNTNGLAFGTTLAAAGTVVYNGTTVSAPLGQTIAAGQYYQLQFTGNAAKSFVTNTTTTTGSGVSIGALVTVNNPQTSGTTTLTINTGGLTLAATTSTMVNDGTINVTGNLDNSGTLTNNGTITVQ